MSQAELSALIIANIQDLDGAAHHLEQTLQSEIGEALDEAARRFCSEMRWSGKFSWDDDELWVAPTSWSTEDAGGSSYPSQRFAFTHDSDDLGELDYFWLTQLVGKGRARLGFAWVRSGISRSRWKKALAGRTDLIEEIRRRGFSYDEKQGTFFLPVVIDADRLARAFAEEALQPFEAALRKLAEDRDIFERLVAETPVD